MLTSRARSVAAFALPLLVGLGTAGCAVAASQDPIGPSCEVRTTNANGTMTLEGVVRTDRKIEGTYRFHVTSSGGGGTSNISQGGAFSAGPERTETLGQVQIGNRGAAFTATLELEVGGKTMNCETPATRT